MNQLQVPTFLERKQSILMEAQARAKLATQSPSQTDKALAVALGQRYGLSKKGRGWVGIGEPDFQLVRQDGEPVDWDGAISAAHLAMTPADDDMLEKALAVVEVQTKRKAEDDSVASLGLRVFVANLRSYPADVVLEVLRLWPSKSMWAPSWFELFQDLERLVAKRRALVHALEWSSKKTEDDDPEPTPKPSEEKWHEAPLLEKPVQPPRLSKEEMAARLSSMMDLVDAHQKTLQQLTEM